MLWTLLGILAVIGLRLKQDDAQRWRGFDCIRRCRGATVAGMRPISNPRAKDVLLYVSSLPDRDRLAVMEAMRDVFPQFKHDGIWSSECERLWREVGDGRLHGERIMNRAFRIAHRLRREMQGAASAPYLGLSASRR